MQLDLRVTDEGRTIVLSGPLDARSTARVRDLVYSSLESTGSDVVLDVADVSWVDATCLRMLAVATRYAERDGRHLVVRSASDHLRHTLRVTRTAHLLDLESLDRVQETRAP